MKKPKTTDDAPESSRKCLLGECLKWNAFQIQTLAMVVYVLVVFAQIFFHEQWEDEVQAWLIARDCSIFQIFHMMRYEGHFALWHLLLHPFAGTGFPLLTLNVISVLLSCIAVWLLLYRSPFSLATKLLLLLSAPLMYWCPVVARSYALVPPLLFLLAICYPLRRQKPLRYAFLLALLANTHVYMEGMVAGLFCFFAWDLLFAEWKQLNTKERNRRIIALLLVLSGVLIAFLQVAPAFAVTHEARFRAETSGQFLQRIRLILDSFATYYMFIRNPAVRFVFWMSLLGALYTLWRCSWRFLLIALSGIVWQFLFAAILYSLASPQQCYLILLMLIFTFWIAAGASPTIPEWQKNRCHFLLHPSVAVFLCLFTIFSYRQTLLYIPYDLRKPFTDYPATAAFIEKNIPCDADIYYFPTHLPVSGLSAYLPRYTLRSGENQRVYTYLILSRELHRDFQPEHIWQCLAQTKGQRFYAIVHCSVARAFEQAATSELKMTLLYRSEKIEFPALTGEMFEIFCVEKP